MTCGRHEALGCAAHWQLGVDLPAQHVDFDPFFPLQHLVAGAYFPPPGQHRGAYCVYFDPHCFGETFEEVVCVRAAVATPVDTATNALTTKIAQMPLRTVKTPYGEVRLPLPIAGLAILYPAGADLAQKFSATRRPRPEAKSGPPR